MAKVKKIKCDLCNFEISAQCISRHKLKCDGKGPRREKEKRGRGWLGGKKFEDVYGTEKSLEIKDKIRKGVNNNQIPKNHTEETKNKISELMKGNTNWKNSIDKTGIGKKGYYKGEFFMSSWELAFMVYCEDHNIKIKRNWKKFDYLDENGDKRKYIPDFVDVIFENKYYEVKGYEPDFHLKVVNFKHDLEIYDKEKMSPILEEIKEKYGKDFYHKLKDSDSLRG
jgi:hypothetical protein